MTLRSSLFVFFIILVGLVCQSLGETCPSTTNFADCDSCVRTSGCLPDNYICQKCKANKQLSVDKKKCGTTITNCLYLSADGTKCELCSSTTTIKADGSGCLAKINNCKQLDSTTTTKCKTCYDGYMLSADGTKCRPAIDNCKFADDNQNYICQQCQDGFLDHYSKRYCYPKIAKCTTLGQIPQYCSFCEPTYYPNGNKTACINSPSDCGEGYKFNGDTLVPGCVQIGAQCASTYFDDGSGIKCINSSGACYEGYFFNNDKTQCIYNTKQCALGTGGGADSKSCISSSGTPDCVDTNFEWDTNNNYCTAKDTQCTGTAKPLKDTTLPTGTADPCVASCPSTTKNAGDGKRCIALTAKCANGYMDDGTGINCVALPTTTNPNTCALGYKYDGTTSKCIPTGSKCGYGFRNDGTDYCISIDSTVDTCAAGFKQNGQAGDCLPERSKCPPHTKNFFTPCKVSENGCGSTDTIENCQPIFKSCLSAISQGISYLKDDGSGKKCYTMYDFECAQGYKSDGEKMCIPQAWKYCAENYKNDGTGKCIKNNEPCAIGFTDNGKGMCVALNQPCAPFFYKQADGRCVASCPLGFTADDRTGECYSKVKNCVQYAMDGTTCVACKPKYFYDSTSKRCLREIENCKYYDHVGNCIECSAEFELYMKKCVNKATDLVYAKTKPFCFSNLKCQWRIEGSYPSDQTIVDDPLPQPQVEADLDITLTEIAKAYAGIVATGV